MRRFWLVSIFAALASPALATSIEAPLEPAAQGKVQCYVPNAASKTCASMSSYRIGEDGALEVVSTTLLAPKPQIIMETTSTVQIKEGRVCGIIQLRDMAVASFTVDGKPAGEQQTYRLRDKVEELFQVLADREACTTYLPDGAALMAKHSLDGVEKPKLDQVVTWVSPEDGFKVGAPQ